MQLTDPLIGPGPIATTDMTASTSALPSHPMGNPPVLCVGVVKIYRSLSGEVHALRGIDAHFPAGVVTAVVGPSGSGKSSLLRILGGLDLPTAGQVTLAGVELTDLSPRRLRALRRRYIGFVHQRPSDNLLSYLSADEHLRSAAALRGLRRPAAVAAATVLLDRLGLGGRADCLPAQLSGGEQQRLGLACAAIGNPAVLLADEPTAELDTAAGASLLGALHDLATNSTAVVLSTHDSRVISTVDRVLALRHGALEFETYRDHHIGGQGDALTVIDSSGRIQLPPDSLDLFPRRRARLKRRDDGVWIEPP